MQLIYRTLPMPKCDLNKVALQLYWNHCFPANLLHIFRTSFTKNTSEQLLLNFYSTIFMGPPRDFRERLNSVFSLREIVNFVFSLREIVNLEVYVIPETHISFIFPCSWKSSNKQTICLFTFMIWKYFWVLKVFLTC